MFKSINGEYEKIIWLKSNLRFPFNLFGGNFTEECLCFISFLWLLRKVVEAWPNFVTNTQKYIPYQHLTDVTSIFYVLQQFGKNCRKFHYFSWFVSFLLLSEKTNKVYQMCKQISGNWIYTQTNFITRMQFVCIPKYKLTDVGFTKNIIRFWWFDVSETPSAKRTTLVNGGISYKFWPNYRRTEISTLCLLD